MVRRKRKAKPRKKYGKIGAPRSAKRKAWMRKIAKKGHRKRRTTKRRTTRRRRRRRR